MSFDALDQHIFQIEDMDMDEYSAYFNKVNQVDLNKKSAQGAQYFNTKIKTTTSDIIDIKGSTVKSGVLALEYKEKGNAFFKDGQFEEAVRMYSLAISYYPDVVYYSNRAACYLKMEKYGDVVRDCSKGLEIDGDNLKCLNRRAMAYKARGDYMLAKDDYERMEVIKPGIAKKSLVALGKLIEEKEVEVDYIGMGLEDEVSVVAVKSDEVVEEVCVNDKVQEIEPNEDAEHKDDSLKEMGSSKDKPEVKMEVPLEVNIEVAVPQDRPKTLFEFMNIWKSLNLAQKKEYITVIPPDTYAQFFKRAVDNDIIHDIILLQEPNAVGIEVLSAITTLPRFSLLSLMMPSNIKQHISHILQEVNDADVAELKNKYKL